MTDSDKTADVQALADAVGRIAWGYLLLHLNINLGRIDILPAWAGYWLILTALPVLGENCPSALLLQPLCQLLAAYSGFVWFAAIIGWTNEIPALALLAGVVHLYFHFQLLTDLAAVGQGAPEGITILHMRTVYTVIATLTFLPFPWEEVSGLTLSLAIVWMIAALCLCYTLFSLRRSLLAREGGIAENAAHLE